MRWQTTPYLFPLLVSAVVAAYLAYIGWRRRGMSGAFTYALLMTAVAIWALGYALELATADPTSMVFWAKIEYVGIVSIPLAWLVFAFQYSGRQHWLSRRRLSFLATTPLLTLTFIWTNELHGLIWAKVRFSTAAGFTTIDPVYGPWFWVHTAISYVYLFLGTILIFTILLRGVGLYRGQVTTLVLGVAIPWIGNAISISGLSPFPQLDITPFTFTLAGLLMGWALLRYRLLDIAPIARGAILENIKDGVIVLDQNARVTDLNKAAEEILACQASEAIGKSADQLLPHWLGIPADGQASDQVVSISLGSSRRFFEHRMTPLYDNRQRLIGWLAMFHDISERKRAEALLRREKETSTRRNTQLVAIAQVARQASSIHDLDDMLNRTARMISEQFNFYHTGIFLLDQAGEYAVLQAANSPGGKRMLDRHHRLSVSPPTDVTGSQPYPIGIVGTAARTGEPRIALDVGKEAVFFDNPDLPETHSEMALPLRIRDKIIGVLDVQSTQEAAFSRDDVEVLQILADQIALAIDNTRLLNEAQDTLNELQAMYGHLSGHTWRMQLTDQNLAYRFDRLGVYPTSIEVSGKHELFGSEYEDDHSLSLPIILRGMKIGSFRLRRDTSQGRWTTEEKELVADSLGKVAQVLENARLFAETQRHAWREQLITEITTKMRASNDPETIMQTAVGELHRALQADQVQILFQPAVERSL